MTRGTLSQDQVTVLIEPIKEGRVYQAQGQSHVAAWDVTAHLTRMFGFGNWDKEIVSLDVVSQARGSELGITAKDGWYVTYRCVMRLHVRNESGVLVCSIDDGATGTAQNQPSLGDAHDFAMKNAISYALKRCAKDLGDQFGLSLYNKGQTGPVVRRTIIDGHGPVDTPAVTDEGYEPGEDPEWMPRIPPGSDR